MKLSFYSHKNNPELSVIQDYLCLKRMRVKLFAYRQVILTNEN